MQKWLDENDILIYSTGNEDKAIVAERFIWILKSKIYNKWQQMIINLIISYLNQLVNEYINTYHLPIFKKAIDADYCALYETNPNPLNLRFV